MKSSMLNIKRLGVAAVMAVSATTATQAATVLDYVSNGGAIHFADGDFTFTNTGGMTPHNIVIQEPDSPANGLMGLIEGVFSIGPVTVNGTQETAAVTDVGGQLSIYDGAHTFTADLSFVSITSEGTGVSLNLSGLANLTNRTYTGTNTALLDLVNQNYGVQVLNFTLIPGMSVTDLAMATALQPIDSSFDGTVAAVPVPAAAFLGLPVLAGMGLQRLRRRRQA